MGHIAHKLSLRHYADGEAPDQPSHACSHIRVFTDSGMAKDILGYTVVDSAAPDQTARMCKVI